MAPTLIFGAGGIGTTPTNFAYTWDTPEKVSALLLTLQKLQIIELDSAASYPPGNAWNTETLLGESGAVKKGFIIDSKVLSSIAASCLTWDNMSSSLDKTLTLLQSDKIRTLYSHGPESAIPIADQAAHFNRLFLQGKFERVSKLSKTRAKMAEYFSVCEEKGYVKPSVYQGCYNALYRACETTLLPLLRKHNCHFYAFSPLAGGFLTGKVTLESRLSATDDLERTRWRGKGKMPIYVEMFDKPAMHDAIRIQDTACNAMNPKLHLQDAALRWLMHHSALKTGDRVILGATSLEQLQSNVAGATGGPLPQSILSAFERVWLLVDDGAEAK